MMDKNQNELVMNVMDLIIPEELQTLQVKNFIAETVNMAQLYSKKNHDYGNAFGEIIKEVGLPYGVGKLKEKLKRVETLINAKAEVNETIEDSITDLACYTVMTSAYLTEKRGDDIDDVDFEDV